MTSPKYLYLNLPNPSISSNMLSLLHQKMERFLSFTFSPKTWHPFFSLNQFYLKIQGKIMFKENYLGWFNKVRNTHLEICKFIFYSLWMSFKWLMPAVNMHASTVNGHITLLRKKEDGPVGTLTLELSSSSTCWCIQKRKAMCLEKWCDFRIIYIYHILAKIYCSTKFNRWESRCL